MLLAERAQNWRVERMAVLDRLVLRLATYASVSALVFQLFFVRLLKVQMPAGVLKQWLF